MSGLTSGELVLVEAMCRHHVRAGLLPGCVEDPHEWDRLAFEALGRCYPINSTIVSVLGDLFFVNAPAEVLGEGHDDNR